MSRTARAAALAAAVLAAYVIWTSSGWPQGQSRTAIANIVFLLVFPFPIVLATLAARSTRGRLRRAWAALAVGLVGWGLGDAIWTYYELGLHEPPFPSVADGAYLLGPIGTCAAMLLFREPPSGQAQARRFLDGVIVAGSLFLVSWLFVLRPVFEAGAESRLGFIVSLAYPVLDLVTLTVAAYVLISAGPDRRLPLTLLTFGVICIALSDSAFVYLAASGEYFSGHPIDIGWMAGLLLIAVAAAAGRDGGVSEHDRMELPSWASIWLPFAPLLLAGVVVAAQPVPLLRSAPVLITAALLVVAVLVRQFLEVSESRRLVTDAADRAMRDPLTGLANRDLFQDRFEHAIQLSRRDELPVGVILIDLDNFKLVNDTLGHLAGDDLLTQVGQQILGCVRPGDTVARLGGDEFAVLVEDQAEHSHLIAQRVVEAFDQPFVIAGQDLVIRPSVGLAIAESDELSLDAEELFQRADTAMYSAKRSGIGGVVTFTAELARADKQLAGQPTDGSGAAMVRLLGELRHAIDQSELDLVYQPKFDLRSGTIVGVEALLRWRHPERGVLGPEQFLFLVRRHGLVGAVTEFVIDRALDDAVRWNSAEVGVPVAINIFAPSIADLTLPERIVRALTDRGLGATALTVEVTEDLIVNDIDNARTVLNHLRDNGVRVSIDDFGSGYSALSYLRDLPVDEVKLDRSFISSVLTDSRAAAVVSAIVELAHALGLTTVAEGVEDAQTANWLREMGCDVGQGYYFSRPLTADELLDSLAGRPGSGIIRSSAPTSARSS